MTDRRGQVTEIRETADEWLQKNSPLSADQRQPLAALVPRLHARLREDRRNVTGIAGPPGSGKSTLARLLVHCLYCSGVPALSLSLDDYYLGRRARERRAASLHPLFAVRGAPGTHDLERLVEHLDRLRSGSPGELALPVFDKARDDRLPAAEWRRIANPPRVILLEGWCIGAPPQEADALARPINELEHKQDSNGVWRRQVRAYSLEYHAALKERLSRLWYIRVPGWSHVVDWRWRQEQERRRQGFDSREAVREFLGTFERIVRHMQAGHRQWADLVLEAGRDHGLCIAEEQNQPRND
jgi:D-glycerate 3-kinase